MHDLSSAAWRKSTHSQGGGNCVEVADLDDGHHAIRDSKNPTGPILIFTTGELAAFVGRIQDGESDPA